MVRLRFLHLGFLQVQVDQHLFHLHLQSLTESLAVFPLGGKDVGKILNLAEDLVDFVFEKAQKEEANAPKGHEDLSDDIPF
jgi:hypothetical protein